SMLLTGAVTFTTAALAQEQPRKPSARIALLAPEDGGTPRDPARIVAEGEREFRVRASVEEGRSPLKDAVPRVDLICRNTGMEPATVPLHLDLSGDGARTNFDDKLSGGMPLRDFLFTQTPGQPWQQVNGRAAGWVSTVSFTAPPGDTKVGLSPWYT